MNYFKTLLLLTVSLMLFSCASDDDSGGAQGGSGEVPSAQTVANAAPTAQTTQVNNPGNIRATESGITKTDNLWYRGRTNGNRPTFYAPRDMKDYPSTFDVSIANCRSFTVNNNNGRRWEGGGYIVKQSHVSSRGLALVAPASCNSSTAKITFVQK